MEAIDLIIKRKALRELQEAIKLVQELDEEFIELAKDVADFSNQKITPKTPKEFNDSLKLSDELLDKLKTSIDKNTEALNRKNNTERRGTRITRTNISQIRSLNSVYGQYSRLLNSLRQRQKDLNTQKALGNRLTRAERQELRKLTRQIRRLDKALKRVDAQSGQFFRNVGNYPGAIRPIISLFRSFAGALGIYSGIQIAEKIFEEVQTLEKLELALQQVTKSQSEFNQSQSFLNDLAEFTGVNIVALTESYIKFRGSLEGSNTSLIDAQRIYERIVKASALLGASTDDVNGVLRALGQIMSKGKIQAEELRGQLGDRLTGAFGLMAKAIGVSTSELDKMLEKGELTSDMLSKLAEQVGDTFGVDEVDSINTVSASIGRMETAWTSLIDSIEGSEGRLSRAIKFVLDEITKTIEGWERLLKTLEEERNDAVTNANSQAFDQQLKFAQQIAKLNGKNADKVLQGIIDGTQSEIDKVNENVKILFGDDLDNLTEAQQDAIQGYLIDLARLQGSLDATVQVQNEYKQALANTEEVNENTLKALRARLKELKEELEVTDFTSPRFEELQGQIQDIQDLIDRLTGKFKGEKEKIRKAAASYFGSINDEAKKTKKEIERIQDILTGTKLEGENEVSFDFEGLASDEEGLAAAIAKAADEANKRLKGITLTAKQESDIQKQIFDDLFSTFSNYYGLDFEAFSKLYSGKKVEVQDYANFAKSLSQALFEGQLIRYENEIAANQEALDAILNDESRSEQQKQAAQAKFDKQEKAIRLKQAKAERRNLLIQIGIDTAAAIVKTAAKLGFPAATPFIAAVSALGLAQAAFVASQPLPRFYKGTKNAPEGFAWTDEKGAELHTDRHGNIKDSGSNKGPRLKYLESGDKIFTAPQTKEILRNSFVEENNTNQMMIDNWIMRKAMTPRIDVSGMEKAAERGVRQGLAKAKLIAKVESPDNYSEY